MADTSNNPQDNVNVEALNKRLAGLEKQLLRLAGGQKDEASARRAGERAATAQSRRDAKVKAADPVVPPRDVGSVAADAERVRKASEGTARSESRIGRNLEHQAKLLDAASRVKSARLFGEREQRLAAEAAASLPRRPVPTGVPVDVTAAADRVQAAARAAEAEARVLAGRRLAGVLAARQAQLEAQAPPPPAPPPPIETTRRWQRRHIEAPLDLRKGQLAAGVDAGAVARQAAAVNSLAEAQGKASAAAEKQAAVQRSARLETTNFRTETSRLNQEARLSAPVYTRNGALTTEFISAAAKGQVTIKELGRQVGLTIGKFAGWTLAAAATYGAVRAIGVLGKGAVDALDAVNKLSRVTGPDFDPDRAQAQLRGIATKFNLPMEEVGEAAYGSAKVFKDQEDIFKGTEAALFAVKVGELDAGTATQALTAIINGLGVGAEALAPIFDKINHLTNSFGGNVGQLTVGLSKSAGAFVNAGGSVDYLLSLLQTGARVTSYSAQEIGTALSRTSERLQQPARRVKVSQLLGISEDDAGDIEKVWERIFERIREGADTQEIAQMMSLVSTPLLATRLIPIAKRESLFRKIQTGTGPEAEGSAERELERVKEAASEQIKAAGIALGNLGAALAQSGALDPLLAIAKTIVAALDAATALVSAFAGLPKPIKQAAVFMAQIAAVAALLKRLDLGGTIARSLPDVDGKPRTLPLSRNPERLARTNTLQGLAGERSFLQERRERANIEAAAIAFEGEQSDRRAKKLLGGRAVEALDEDELKEYNRHIARANRHAEQAADLADTAEDARSRDVEIQKKEAGVKRRTSVFRGSARQTTAEAAAAEELDDFYRPDAQDRVSNTQAVPIIAPGGAAVREGLDKTDKAQTAAANDAKQTTRQALKTGATATTLGAVTRTGAVAMGGVRSGLTAARTGLSALAVGLASIFGPIEAIIAAAIASYMTVKSGQEQIDAGAKLLAETADAKGQYRAAKKELGDDSRFDKIQSGFLKYTPLGLGLSALGAQAPDDSANENARQAIRDSLLLRREQQKGRRLTQAQIARNLKTRLAAADTGAERDAAIARAEQEQRDAALTFAGRQPGKVGRAALKAGNDNIRRLKAEIAGGVRGLQERLELLTSADEFAAFNAKTQNRIKQEGPTRTSLRELTATANQLRTEAARIAQQTDLSDDDAEEIAKLLTQADAAEAQVVEEADRRLKETLAAATTPQEAGRATRAYVRTIAGARNQTGGRAAELERNVVTDKARRAALQAEQRADQAALSKVRGTGRALPALGDPIGGAIPFDQDVADAGEIRTRMEQRKKKIVALGTSIKKDDAEAEALRKQLGLSRAAFRELIRAVNRSQFDLEQEAADADLAVVQSQTGDPLVAARAMSGRLRAKTQGLRRQMAKHQATRAEVQNAIAAENENLKQIADAELARSESQRQLATSRFALTNPSEGAMTERLIADARAALADVRSKGSLVDPTRLLDAERAVNEAMKQRAEAVKVDAEALIRAQGAYAESLTEDPARKAQIAAQTARKLEKFANTPTEKLEAKAATRNARNEAKQAVLTAKIDDIDFNYEFDKITREQAIAQLESLAKSSKYNKAQKRELLRRAKALKEQDEKDPAAFNLGVGNIKLPTVYDVRRGAAQVRALDRSAPALSRADVAGIRSSVVANVVVNVNDKNAAGEVYGAIDRVLRTSVRSRMRNAQVR